MAQLKSSVVQGSLRVTDTTYTTNLNLSSGTASQIVKTDANKNLITGTLSKSDVGLGNVENTALSTWQGTTNIKTVGTITSGTWQGTAIGASYLPTATTGALGIVKIGTNISVSSGTISVASGSTSTAGIVKLTDSYTSTDGSNATTGKALLAALQTLDGNLNNTTPGAGKTLTAFSQTDGKVSATFGNISITKSQVSDFSHTHPWSEITSQPTLTNVAISANITTNANYPIVFATSNKDTTAAKNEGLQKSGAKFYFNPSTGNVQATTFNGYTLAAASEKGVVTTVDTSANLPTSNAVKTFVEGKGYVTSSGVTSVATGAGLTGGTITGTGTIKAYLKSETKATYDSATVTNTSSRQYAVTPDKTGYLSVNVPWADTHRVIKVNGTQALASNTTALNLIAGSNVSITDGGSGAVTIAATDTKYNAATTSTAGLMSAADKTKLNGIDIRYTENSTAPSNPITGTIWLQKKPSSSANGGNMPNAMFQTVSITIPYNTTQYTYSNEWITNETAIVATNLATIGFRDTYMIWNITTGQIVFYLGAAVPRNITFQIAMIK